jgi:hypothetical protein
MANLTIRMFDANRNPLNDVVDIEVRDAISGDLRKSSRKVKGTSTVLVKDLDLSRTYRVSAFPLRHRPVGALTGAGTGSTVELFAPVDPRRVTGVRFPAFKNLDPALKAVLERSVPEPEPAPPGGAVLYDLLEDEPKAGLLNLFTKMSTVRLDGKTAWDFIDSLYRIRGDRIFADVRVDFRDAVQRAVTAGEFEPVPGTLHTPPPEFASAGSFKTLDHDGVQQLTFFASSAGPVAPGSFRANAFGLYDMHGNVREWTTDLWHESYESTPLDGSPAIEGHGSMRVVRGGGWSDSAPLLRSAARMRATQSIRTSVIGFRVARTLG